jgi:hypothetical protein
VGRQYYASLEDIEEAAKVFLVTRDLDHFNRKKYNTHGTNWSVISVDSAKVVLFESKIYGTI